MAEKKAEALGRRMAAEEAKLKRKKKRREKVAKMNRRKKALEELCKKKQGEKTKQVCTNVKKILYCEPKLETVIPMDVYRLRRYYEKVEKEQDERRLMRKMLEQAHVLSPFRKRKKKQERSRQRKRHMLSGEHRRKNTRANNNKYN